MAYVPKVRLRKYSMRRLVDKAEAEKNPPQTEYRFSSGRTFQRRTPTNRTA